jgi:hypothetical protein
LGTNSLDITSAYCAELVLSARSELNFTPKIGETKKSQAQVKSQKQIFLNISKALWQHHGRTAGRPGDAGRGIGHADPR